MKSNTYTQSMQEELGNALTHGLGALAGFYAFWDLMNLASKAQSFKHYLGYGFFGLSLVLLYLASTTYHLLKDQKKKDLFKKIDHICIYLLIAGSYTPFLLINFKGEMGPLMMALIWVLALIGVFFKIFSTKKSKFLRIALYLGMGWLIMIAYNPLMEQVPKEGIKWIFIGGVFYTVGVFFYLMKRLPFHHTIWHLFVMGGTFSHYLAIKHSFQI